MIAVILTAYACVGVYLNVPHCIDHLRRFHDPHDWVMAGASTVLMAFMWPYFMWKAWK